MIRKKFVVANVVATGGLGSVGSQVADVHPVANDQVTFIDAEIASMLLSQPVAGLFRQRHAPPSEARGR